MVKKTESASEVVYKLYDFQYHEILIEKFKRNNILIKSLILFSLVVKKLPQLLARMFKRENYNRPYQTFYAFLILFIISFSIVFLIPASVDMFLDVSIPKGIKELLGTLNITLDNPNFNISLFLDKLRLFGKATVPVITFVLLIVPESKTTLTSMATEFACVDRYIKNGEQSQIVLGNLDLLMDFVAEREHESKIHIHAYSFGCIVAMDLLFPLGTVPAKNTITFVKAFISIGNPYEFVKAYYPQFFKNRCKVMDDKIHWINIYSIADALATNFRKDGRRGDAEFGIVDNNIIPHNLNFETTSDRSIGFFNFFSLHSLSVHKCYWDSSPSGQSCVRILIHYMLEKGFIQN